MDIIFNDTIDRIALQLCISRNEDPEGEEVLLLPDGEVVRTDFLEKAKRDVRIVLKALEVLHITYQ